MGQADDEGRPEVQAKINSERQTRTNSYCSTTVVIIQVYQYTTRFLLCVRSSAPSSIQYSLQSSSMDTENTAHIASEDTKIASSAHKRCSIAPSCAFGVVTRRYNRSRWVSVGPILNRHERTNPMILSCNYVELLLINN